MEEHAVYTTQPSAESVMKVAKWFDVVKGKEKATFMVLFETQ